MGVDRSSCGEFLNLGTPGGSEKGAPGTRLHLDTLVHMVLDSRVVEWGAFFANRSGYPKGIAACSTSTGR